MSRTSKTEAIVLKKKNLPSQDMIVTLFTQEMGKMRILAKGVKKISSKRLPHLQTGNVINVVLYNSDKKSYLQEASLISGLTQIKNDSKKLSFLYFYFHLLDRLLPENQQEVEIYKTVKLFLIDLSKSDAVTPLLEKHLNVLLRKLGYINKKGNLEELHRLVEELMNEKVPLLII
jgi:DNA repair protein RecO